MFRNLVRQQLLALDEAKVEDRRCTGRAVATLSGQEQQRGATRSIKKRRTLRMPRTVAATAATQQVQPCGPEQEEERNSLQRRV